MNLILASQSPRRKQLLEQMGFSSFSICPAQGEEVIPPGSTPAQAVEVLSRQKAAEISAQAGEEAVVIGSDTVVALDGQILGKPRSKEEAFAMLTALSGRQHTVYTGVTVQQGTKCLTAHEATLVHFRPLTPQEIEAYIATGEPMDKAGAYGIQGFGALFVQGLEGDYYNVMGLPICRLGQMLAQFGLVPLIHKGGVL